MQVQSLGWEDSLEEGMATPSSILKWRAWQPTPVLWKIHGQRSLVGYSPWHHKRVEHDGNGLVRVCMCAHTHMCTHMHEGHFILSPFIYSNRVLLFQCPRL